MEEKELNQKYWMTRWLEDQTGWDTNGITTPIKEYVDKIADKEVKILIPGCGNAHEAHYLHQEGFKNVFICDWAEAPLLDFHKKLPSFPKHHLLHADFFELKKHTYDYIIEQTFFCALSPNLRPKYASKMKELLCDGGRLVGLLFNFPLTETGPPFGGSKEEYFNCFNPCFNTVSIEPCYNSIEPRSGTEFFIKMKK